ncbi:MAG: dTDP-4-dehydrorhamnose 3,5-epimerase [Rhodobacterales bacterium 17-64-5]|nr:MAG: dTDP-4-dehydrorhamnose 3,5-epimerase [Rhodobacterales bacterium 17-64-5]
MKVLKTGIEGVFILTPRRFGDARGWFSETWNRAALAEAGIEPDFIQDNHSFSAEQCTLRGLHYQAPPRAQDKLVRCLRGAILDVALDARRGSPTFGNWIAEELSADNGRQLLVPKGFLHGFVTLTPGTEVQYKVSDTYAPEADGSVRWDSAGVDWGLSTPPVLSVKDATAPTFADWQSPFIWEGVA